MAGRLKIIDNLEGRAQATPDDYQMISDLVVKVLRGMNENSNNISEKIPYTQTDLEWLISRMSPESIKQKSEPGYLVVYEEDGKMYGVGCLSKVKDIWLIRTLYVDIEQQGKRIGSQILTKLEEKARALGIDRLELAAINFDSTVEFYKRKGYKATHHIYYKAGPITIKEVHLDDENNPTKEEYFANDGKTEVEYNDEWKGCMKETIMEKVI